MGLQTKPATFLAKCKKPPPLTPPPGAENFSWRGLGGVCPPNRAGGASPLPSGKGMGDGSSD